MFKKSRICTGVLIAISAIAANAQTQLERVEITGSAIKRVDAETAVPITVIKAEELKKQGVTTVEQVMASLTAVQMTTTTSQVVGSGSGGYSFANLRGIGANKTLVLLNGRRIANNAYDSSAPDLNMIPFAAIERVEVLRDGASALYGTDAVGGVINFITRKDFVGGVITLGADQPKDSGGAAKNANAGFGFGDLSKDGYNVFGFIDVNQQDRIAGTERPYNARFPGGLSPTPYPANYYQNPNNPTANPAGPGCTTPSFLVPSGDGSSCYIATSQFVNYTPKSDRTSAMIHGNVKLGESTLSLEWFGTQNKVESLIAPVPYGTLWMNPTKPDGTPNPYYPGNPGSTVTPSIPLSPTYTVTNMNPRAGVALQPGFIIVKWRDLAHGQRTDSSTNDQQRFVAQLDGTLSAWDYQVGLSYNENKVKQDISGYSDGNKITAGMLNGVLNPFGDQGAAGTALIADSGLSGNLQNATGKVTTLDARASREFGDWFNSGRKVALAVGGEFRREEFWSAANTPFAELVVASTGVDPASLAEGSRNISAVYGELNVPIVKQLEATVAVRYDKYSDFGSSTNPKFSLRYQPRPDLVMRGTYSTGFRAPSLYEINSSPYYTNTGTMNDPINCPGGTAIDGKSSTLNCKIQAQALYGGNTSLQPEKAKNFTLGLVFDATRDLSVGVDLWWIRLEHAIGSISFNTANANPVTFASLYHRNSAGDLSIDGFSCPGADCGYIDLRTQNLGGTNTNGVDLSARYGLNLKEYGNVNFALSSTYVTKYEYQDYTDGPWNQNVGIYSGAGPVFRWQHALNATWNRAAWTVGMTGHYKSGYIDQDPSNTVSQYATLDAFVGYTATKNLSLTLGVKNLTNREPPYSNQGDLFQANYDPRFSDPTGRMYYVRGSYKF